MRELLHKLADWAVAVVEALGYAGVAFLVALENLIPPIPSEVILPLAGFSVSQGELSFIGVNVAATAGSLIGALILYGISRWVGEVRLRRFIRRFEWLPFVNEADVDNAQAWFGRHGGTAVLIGRLVPVIRSVVSVPAGFARMPLGLFILYTTLGSAIWNGALITLGWILGEQWMLVRQYTQYLEYAVVAVLLAAILWFVWRRWSARSGGSRSPAVMAADEEARGRGPA
jgi:membrane protein DedA with SNARE-associated domain